MMKFIDTAKIFVKSGDGGSGHVSFRREKYVPKGGPDGGNGGKGGDIVIIANSQLTTLLDFKYQYHFKAENGQQGGKNRRSGRSGKDINIFVPCGTFIRNVEDDSVIVDLVEDGQKFILAKGGRGGRGNSEFATPTNQAPRYFEPGEPGIELEISLELKIIAEIGIIGLPNVGKSTLISVISQAKPKIADYPFTTLVPNIGIVKYNDKSFSVTDIPGLIEGAAEGKGLGLQFLRHIERTKALVFLIDSNSETPSKDFRTLTKELKKYNPQLLEKSRIICLSKADLLSPEDRKKLKRLKFGKNEFPPILISSVTHEGIDNLINSMGKMIYLS